MKNFLFAVIFFTAIVSSCVPRSRMHVVEAKLDSLTQVNAIYEESMTNMSHFIDALAMSLDSIAVSEDILLLTKGDGYGVKNSRYQMMENLSEFEELLARQKNRINELDSILAIRVDSTSKMRVLLNHYRNQLNDKEVYITGLKEELTVKNRRIRNLEGRVNEMSGEIEKLEVETNQLENILVAQTDYINKGYFWIAAKKDLKRYGVLKGMSKVNLSNAPLSEFVEVDIRRFTEVTISTSSVKILSPVPEDSYVIEKYNDGTCVLKITRPSLFWSLSSYLVIQIK